MSMGVETHASGDGHADTNAHGHANAHAASGLHPDGRPLLALRFEEHRSHLRAVAYRMLGSIGEAEDAVQEAWLRLSRTDVSDVENLGGWLTTVVARLCLNGLRARETRREDSLDDRLERLGRLDRGGSAPRMPDPSSPAKAPSTPRSRYCWPIPSDWRCSWCSNPSLRRSGWRSSCTTCSPCPSTRSP